VRAAGATARLALEGYTWTGDLFIDGRPEVWGRELRHKAITPGFFAAAGIPILQGRDFNSADTSRSQPVVIVNRTLARQYFNGVNPVGQRLTFGRPSPTTVWATIVAVVADEKQDGLATEIKPEVYDPQTQGARETMSFVVRTFGNPLGMLPAVRREIAALDARLAIYDVRTLEQVVERSIASERFATTVLTGFAGAALLLAAIGLYGVVAFAVSARTREIGLRLALGASRRSVLRMVVWDGLSVVLAGLAAGLLAAAALSGVIQAFLFDTRAADPVVLLSATGILTAAGVIASYVPALRAAHVDPAVSLRSE
jgi:predicted permease